MITEVLLYRLQCDKCSVYVENPDTGGDPLLWGDEEEMKTEAIKQDWAITHNFHLCNQCKT